MGTAGTVVVVHIVAGIADEDTAAEESTVEEGIAVGGTVGGGVDTEGVAAAGRDPNGIRALWHRHRLPPLQLHRIHKLENHQRQTKCLENIG